MNRQTYALLSKLIDSRGTVFSYQELAASLDVGVRSVRNYISLINEFLDKADLEPISTFPGGTAGLLCSWEQARTIRDEVLQSDYYLYKLTPEERVQIIELLFLSADRFITLTELSRQLYVSKGTLIKDLEAVERGFKGLGIALDPMKTRGYKLVISEGMRRDLLVKRFRLLLNKSIALQYPTSIYDHFIDLHFRLSEREPLFQEAIMSMERKNGVRIEDSTLRYLIILLSVFVERVFLGAFIGEAPEMDVLSESGVYTVVAAHICQHLQQKLSLDIPGREMLYLAEKLKSRGLGAGRRAGAAGLEMHIAVKSFLHGVSEELAVPIEKSNKAQSLLVSNIWDDIHRQKLEPEESNYYREEYIRQYPETYNAVLRHSEALQKYFGYGGKEDEVFCLLLNVLAAVECFYADRVEPSVIVVCNTGAGTANFLKEKLKRNFKIRILDTIPHYRLPGALEREKPDLIISTIPLEIPGVPCVQISPVLGEGDLFIVRRALDQVGKDLTTRLPGDGAGTFLPAEVPLAGLFIPSHIDMSCTALDWRDAITRAGKLLIDSGDISFDYIDEMIRMVEEHGPYIVFAPGVALAHGRPPQDCQATCASLVRLSPPVSFGHPDNDPVQYVLAVQTPDSDEHFHTLFRVMNMMCDEGFRGLLGLASDSAEACQVIRDYEMQEHDGPG